MPSLLTRTYHRFSGLIPELAKFGTVGLIGSVIDLGGAAYLHGPGHMGPLKAKAISITVATVVTYLGSRFWTFRHRVNQAMLREGVLFFGLNIVGLLIAELVIAFTSYGLGLKDGLAYNAASLFGTGLGTIFRYFAYKKWVFLAPETAEAVPYGLAEDMAYATAEHAAAHRGDPAYRRDPAYRGYAAGQAAYSGQAAYPRQAPEHPYAPAHARAQAAAPWEQSREDAPWRAQTAAPWEQTGDVAPWQTQADVPQEDTRWQTQADPPRQQTREDARWRAPADAPSGRAPADAPSGRAVTDAPWERAQAGPPWEILTATDTDSWHRSRH